MTVQPTYEELLQEITQLKKEKTTWLAGENTHQKEIASLRTKLQANQKKINHLFTENRQLARLSNTDGLTTLFNHRYMMERCNLEFERAKRYNSNLSCVLLDIDHFKDVNDRHGHQFGDFILSKLGKLLKENTRSTDICGRYGGEEFIILITLPGEEAMEYVLRLHQTIAEQSFSDGTLNEKITVSIGLAEYRCEMQSWHELISRADQTLYLAKNSGRNMVRTWSDRIDETPETIDNYNIDNLKKQFASIYNEMKTNYVESTNALLKAIDAKDHYTLRHSRNVSIYATRLAEALHLKKPDVATIRNAALLHDLGKIGIDEELLAKNESLTDEEYEILKKHPAIGVNIIKNISLLAKEVPIILHHHERYDGRGYPHGLQSSEIPLGAKILAIADAFDAMTTARSFKDKLTEVEALEVIVSEKGKQFDPELVDVFVMSIQSRLIPAENKTSSDIAPRTAYHRIGQILASPAPCDRGCQFI